MQTIAASEKQMQFIDRLVIERVTDPIKRDATYKRMSQGLTKSEAKQWIDRLLALPKPAVPATVKQLAFAQKLAAEKLEGDALDAILARIDDTTTPMNVKDASALIDQLIQLPKLRTVPQQINLPQVPKGRYAVESAEGKLTFYHVRIDTKGKVTIDLKHGPATTPVPFTVGGYTTILQTILDAGIGPAMARYGKELGSCGKCGADLTDKDSRARGLGPICASNLGM